MNKPLYAIFVTSCVAALVGCATDSAVDRNFGNSYHEAIARTTDDPEGSAMNAGLRGPSGLDGKTAEQVIGKYRSGMSVETGPSLPLPIIVTDDSSLGTR